VKNIESIIKNKIHSIRGKQVMLDFDLAELYGVETRVLNQAVKRNSERFPERCVFQLTVDDMQHLKSQIVTSSWGGRRKPVYAFSEHGVSMLSAVLRSEKAVEISLKIIDAFVAMRNFLIENKEVFLDNYMIKSKLLEHENKISYILDELKSKDLPEKGVFFEGQIFDAYKLTSIIY